MKRLSVFAALLAFCIGCSGAETTRHVAAPPAPAKLSENEKLESIFGGLMEQFALEPNGTYENERLDHYVHSIGEKVARCAPKSNLPWRVSIIDSPVVFGHALPAARIQLSRGLLAYLSSEAELAAVLSHEMAHVGHGHTLEGWRPDFPPLGSGAREHFAFERDRDEERQADALGTEYLACAGYAPDAMGRALEALERATPPSSDDTSDDKHPAPRTRLARLHVQADGRSGVWNRERYLAAIDGLVFGEGETPALEGSRYVSPGELSFALPVRYDVELQNAMLTTKHGEPSLLILRLAGKTWRDVIQTALTSETHTVQSIAGARAIVSTFGAPENPALIALVEGSRHAFVIAVSGGAPESRAVLDFVLDSARRAPPAMQPKRRIAIRRASHAESFSSFVRTSCPSTSLELGRALNGIEARAVVRPGALLKCAGP